MSPSAAILPCLRLPGERCERVFPLLLLLLPTLLLPTRTQLHGWRCIVGHGLCMEGGSRVQTCWSIRMRILKRL